MEPSGHNGDLLLRRNGIAGGYLIAVFTDFKFMYHIIYGEANRISFLLFSICHRVSCEMVLFFNFAFHFDIFDQCLFIDLLSFCVRHLIDKLDSLG